MLVVGLGVSGTAAAQAAHVAGWRVSVCDERRDDLASASADLLGCDVAVVDDPEALLRDAPPDTVVASPGVAPSSAVLTAARAAHVPIWSEPELAWRLLAGRTRVLAVTGTNGKTTTTELLAACVDAPAVGNIGRPLSALVGAPPPLVVAELSSFQLHFAHTLRADVAVLCNIADDHLDWHGGREAYAGAKARVWRGQRGRGGSGLRGRDWAVVNLDDPGALAQATATPPPGARAGFTVGAPPPDAVGVVDGVLVERLTSTQPVPVAAIDTLAVHGPHNVANAAAAVAAAVAAGIAPAALGAALASVGPGAHRLQVVADRDGVAWVDDSKATNPHAASAALRSFDSVVWIAGGLGKGVSFAPLHGELAGRVRLAITIGTAGPELAAVARAEGVEVVEAGDLDRAVAVAADRARPGDTVLLAPAAASMDQFTNYAERGDRFAAMANSIGARS